MNGRWSTIVGVEPAPAPALASVQQGAPAKRGGLGTILAVLGIGVAIIASSPGARFFYKHGRLPE